MLLSDIFDTFFKGGIYFKALIFVLLWVMIVSAANKSHTLMALQNKSDFSSYKSQCQCSWVVGGWLSSIWWCRDPGSFCSVNPLCPQTSKSSTPPPSLSRRGRSGRLLWTTSLGGGVILHMLGSHLAGTQKMATWSVKRHINVVSLWAATYQSQPYMSAGQITKFWWQEAASAPHGRKGLGEIIELIIEGKVIFSNTYVCTI